MSNVYNKNVDILYHNRMFHHILPSYVDTKLSLIQEIKIPNGFVNKYGCISCITT